MALLRPFELLSFLRSDVLNSLPRQRLAQAFPGLLPRRRRNLKRQTFAAAQDLDFVLYGTKNDRWDQSQPHCVSL